VWVVGGLRGEAYSFLVCGNIMSGSDDDGNFSMILIVSGPEFGHRVIRPDGYIAKGMK